MHERPADLFYPLCVRIGRRSSPWLRNVSIVPNARFAVAQLRHARPIVFFFFFSLFNVAVDRVDRLVALFFFYFYYSPVFTTTKKASSSFQL